MKALHGISFVLLVVGGLNWLLVGLGMWFGGNWNLVTAILGGVPWLEALVYVLVGLSAVKLIISHKKDCNWCDKSGTSSAPQM